MRVNQTIQISIYDGTQWIDQTEGLLNIYIGRGCNSYAGPQSQPDVGQLIITSKNENLDPYVSNYIRYNNLVRVVANGVRIFTGKIDGIDVEYRAKDKPIVKLTIVDLIGTMQKHVLSPSFSESQPINWTTPQLLLSIDETQEIEGYQNNAIVHDGTSNVSSSIDDQATAWNAIALRAITDLGFVYVDVNNLVNYYRLPITDPLHPNNSREIKASFDYYGNELSYKSISLNDGFDNIVNQLEITGNTYSRITDSTTTAKAISTAIPSINLWGKSKTSLELLTTNATKFTNISDAIFVEVANPVREVYEITFDASKYPDIVHTIDILDNININHLITESKSIDRKYSVVGIRHDIGYDYWNITYVVKNWNFKDSAMATPTISISPTSGDQFTDYTFSYTIDPSESLTGQYWTLGEGFVSSDESVTVNYVNPGVKTISLTVTNIYGWQKTVTTQLTVGASPPITSFTKTLISFNRYQFTFTGQEASSYSWNFGNGRTSTEQNPITYFESASSVTVSLVATNQYGSNTASETFTPAVVTRLPIRYVKFITWNWDWSNPDANGAGSYNGITELRVIEGGVNIAANKQVSIRKLRRSFASSVSTFDQYRRRTEMDDSIISTYLTNETITSPAYLMGTYNEFTYGDTGYVSTDGSNLVDSAAIIITIDLGQEYFDISNVQLYKQTGSTEGSFRVLGSINNINWYNLGTIAAGSSTNLNIAFTTTLPITLSWPSYDVTSNIKPVRYVKVVTNNTVFSISGLVASCDIPFFTYTTTFNSNGWWGYGNQSVNSGTGCRYFVGPNSQPIDKRTNGSIGTRYYAGQEIPGTLGDKSLTTNVYWGDTDGPREIIMDFGVNHYNLCGIGIDTRDHNGNVTTSASNSLQVYISEDGTNWVSLDTVTLNASSSTLKGFHLYQQRSFVSSPSGGSAPANIAVPFTNTNRTIAKGSHSIG
jgi:PKD repeat protein